MGESPPSEEDVELEMEEEEDEPMTSEEGESPVWIDDGSGSFEGSATEDMLMADLPFGAAESDTGSGESWAEKGEDLYKGNILEKCLKLHGINSFQVPHFCLIFV